jgi:hypothetical protein
MNWFKRLFGGGKSNPEDAVNEATDSARAVLGTDLVAAYTYGSFATGEYIEGHSNINMLFVTRRLDAETLKKLAPTALGWKKFSSLKPLFFSLPELRAYSDSFPMEFGDIAENRDLIGGEDVFLKIETSNARLAEELESEIKNRLIKLRQRYLLSGGDEATTRVLMAVTAGSLFPVLRAFLRLKKRKPPKQRVRLIEEACRSYRFSRRTLLQAHDLRYGRKNAERIETWPLFEKLIQELTLMAELAAKCIQESPAAEERAPRRDRGEHGESERPERERPERGDREQRRDRGDRDRGRDRDRDRDGGSSQRGGGDRNAKLGQVKQLIQEASQRKKWEPKDPERFQSDEFSRDLGLTLSARFGWDKAWQPERRAKGYVPVAPEPVAVEEPTYEEEFGEAAQAEEAQAAEGSAEASPGGPADEALAPSASERPDAGSEAEAALPAPKE